MCAQVYTEQKVFGSNILLISDSPALMGLVGATLERCDSAQAPPADSGCPGDLRLIVLAVSSARHEPLALLAQVGLASAVGSVPLLILSRQPFRADLARHILRLPFPLRTGALPPIVEYLLLAAPQLPN